MNHTKRDLYAEGQKRERVKEEQKRNEEEKRRGEVLHDIHYNQNMA